MKPPALMKKVQFGPLYINWHITLLSGSRMVCGCSKINVASPKLGVLCSRRVAIGRFKHRFLSLHLCVFSLVQWQLFCFPVCVSISALSVSCRLPSVGVAVITLLAVACANDRGVVSTTVRKVCRLHFCGAYQANCSPLWPPMNLLFLVKLFRSNTALHSFGKRWTKHAS